MQHNYENIEWQIDKLPYKPKQTFLFRNPQVFNEAIYSDAC